MDVFLDTILAYKNYLLVAGVIIFAFITSKVVRSLLNKYFDVASTKLKVDPTQYKFFKNVVSLIIFSIASIIILYLIPSLKSVAITLTAGAGIFAAILGFASQEAFSNIIGGIFIVIFKPFRVGDLIRVGSLSYGIVEDITLRHTVINSFENKRIIIPNTTISSETIINDSILEEKICKFVEIGISYDSDVDKAIAIMQEEAVKHPKCIDNRTDLDKKNGKHQVAARLVSFGDSSLNLRAYVWTDDPVGSFEMGHDLNKAIKKRFDEESIEIPFPYRTIVFKDKNSTNKFTEKS